jgi:hypothetical protein
MPFGNQGTVARFEHHHWMFGVEQFKINTGNDRGAPPVQVQRRHAAAGS